MKLSFGTASSFLVMFGIILGIMFLLLLSLGVLLLLLGVSLRLYLRRARPKRPLVAFFHPYCTSGGGGERVLWHAVQALQQHYKERIGIAIYCGDVPRDPAEILAQVERCFGVKVDPVEFVFVKSRFLLQASCWPRFTMLGQSFGSVLLAAECLSRLQPHVFADTTGFAFTYPLAKLVFGCRILTYTHYPTISNDMLRVVRERNSAHNNDPALASSVYLSGVKVLYYRAFAWCYGKVGAAADVVLVNSSWTRGHIASLWSSSRPAIVFPPCDTESLRRLSLEPREPLVISVAQFRPEKNHRLQIEAFSLALKQLSNVPREEFSQLRLVLIGGVRDELDQNRVDQLKLYAQEKGVADRVDFLANLPFSELIQFLSRGVVGLHTMWNEHFGIGVVEYMAAGLVTLAHDSGGPRADIVVPFKGGPTGFLATNSAEAFSEQLVNILQQYYGNGGGDGAAPNDERLLSLRQRAREHVQTFSAEVFERQFLSNARPLLDRFSDIAEGKCISRQKRNNRV